MDTLNELAKGDGKATFVSHVFNFETESKNEMLNISQYALIAIIPIVLINKLMQIYIPDADEDKGTFEIVAEVIFQVLFIFIGMLIINRIITFVPTYSETKYESFNPITVILPTLVIILSLQTKLGDKVGILSERVADLWEKQDKNTNTKSKVANNVKISQPIGGQPPPLQTALDGTTSISQLNAPTNTNFDNMYQQTPTPLVNASTPGNIESLGEPTAANEAMGGGFGGSAW